jgi:hypothetical protein
VIGQVEPFDAQSVEAEILGLLAQRHDLRRDLYGGDDLVAFLGKADGRGFAEAGAGPGNEDGLGHGRSLSMGSENCSGELSASESGHGGLRDIEILRDGSA